VGVVTYRDDLEAARARIDALEHETAEQQAELGKRAAEREAELAEREVQQRAELEARDAELGRLRKALGKPEDNAEAATRLMAKRIYVRAFGVGFVLLIAGLFVTGFGILDRSTLVGGTGGLMLVCAVVLFSGFPRFESD